MAPPAGTLRVWRYFVALLILFAVLYLVVFWPGQRHTPKLGLDLEGGAQVVYQAKTPNGSAPSKSSMNEAKDIMTQRVNGSGVANAEVVIQGSDQIVVSIPGKNVQDLADLGKAAKLNFRPLVMPAVPFTAASSASSSATSSATPTPSAGASATKTGAAASPSATHSARNNSARQLVAPSATPTPLHSATPTPTPAASASPTPAKSLDPLKGLKFPIPKNEDEYNKLTAAQRQQLQSAVANFDCTNQNKPPDIPSQPLLACDQPVGSAPPAQIYLLGPVIVAGTQISGASAVAPNLTSGQTQWTVSLNLKPSGQTAWANYTSKHHSVQAPNIPAPSTCGASTAPCAEYVAFTLDGQVISAPHNEAAINGGTTQISGSFTQSSAEKLAQQLKYGALPLDFKTLTSQNVSASLGSSQLKAGLLAGGIGLILVVVYSLIYYRALGLVTIASLIVSGGLIYACLVILGKQIGFTLTLAGIAGFIVAVGITADSFVVFFERIKDEVREGRSARAAVPRAWVRARRTILSADTVSFLAAAVLYYFAAGDVKGFAFTLGLSTILDLVVVFLFTHPMISLFSRSRAFGSGRFSGLNAMRDGGVVVDAPPAVARRAPREKPKRPAAKPVPTPAPVDREAVEHEEPAVPFATEAPLEPAQAEPAPAQRAGATPQPGTAAERAAARRARLRAEAAAKKGGE